MQNNVPKLTNGVLSWQIDGELDTIKMEFWIKNISGKKCLSGVLPIYTTDAITSLCYASMVECDIKIVTGKSNLNICNYSG